MPTSDNNQHYDMGYLTRALEDIKASVMELKEDNVNIRKEIAEIKKDWSIAKAVVRTLKIVGFIMIALAAGHWKDIPAIWSGN